MCRNRRLYDNTYSRRLPDILFPQCLCRTNYPVWIEAQTVYTVPEVSLVSPGTKNNSLLLTDPYPADCLHRTLPLSPDLSP